MITKDQMNEWQDNSTTKLILSALRELREVHTNQIIGGSVLNLDCAEKTGVRVTYHLGVIKGLNSILEMEVEDESEKPS
jgi:hypothetical protein